MASSSCLRILLMTDNHIPPIASEHVSYRPGKALSIEEFRKLLEDSETKTPALQVYASNLLLKGVKATEINSRCYSYFVGVKARKKSDELQRAMDLANAFSEDPFYWHCWMSSDGRG